MVFNNYFIEASLPKLLSMILIWLDQSAVSRQAATRNLFCFQFVCLFWPESGLGPAAGPGPGKMEENYFPVKVVELPRKIEI